MKAFWIVLVIILALCVATVQAQDTGDPEGAPADLEDTIDDIVEGEPPTAEDPDDNLSTFTNPAHARRVENLAFKLATEENQELTAALGEVQEKADEYASAREKYEDLKTDPNALEADIKAAEDAMNAAHESLLESKAEAREKLAESTATSTGEIEAKRRAGMGWGRIAHELGVHPGALGLGHYKGPNSLDLLDEEPVVETPETDPAMMAHNYKLKNNFRHQNRNKTNNSFKNKFAAGDLDGSPSSEIAAATERDVKTGWSKGHGGNSNGAKSGGGGSGADGETGEVSGRGNSGKSGISGKASSSNSSSSGNKGGKSNNGKSKRNSKGKKK